MFRDSVSLIGQSVRLEPLLEHHFDALMHIAQQSPAEFRFTSTPIDEEQKKTYFGYAFRTRDEGRAYPWVMIDTATQQVAGTTRLYDANWDYRHCLLGYTWFDTRLFGSAFNVESKYLMLKYAFEELNLIRVQMNTDSRNGRSLRAIKALGARYEGTLRSSQINKDGYIRDNLIFSIIAEEWSLIKQRLEERIQAKL
ncbi:MAG: GNAT family N-acetyltransferase [Trueperaceae bacterium]|nr:GNAT family N-acetyltransferase [Trueperaceae bacterium]